MLTPHASALLLLLPLALASCPCPTAPATAKVCGSNNVTYDSQCALDCAGLPGLISLHPGPCSHIETMIFNASLPNFGNLNPRGSVRSATDDLAKAEECYDDKCKAPTLNCECDFSDPNSIVPCMDKCFLTCRCDCFDIPSGSANMNEVRECEEKHNCTEKLRSCAEKCDTEDECNKCVLDNYMCDCTCNGESTRLTTSSPSSPTTSSTTSPTTSATLSLRPTLGLSISLLAVCAMRTAK